MVLPCHISTPLSDLTASFLWDLHVNQELLPCDAVHDSHSDSNDHTQILPALTSYKPTEGCFLLGLPSMNLTSSVITGSGKDGFWGFSHPSSGTPPNLPLTQSAEMMLRTIPMLLKTFLPGMDGYFQDSCSIFLKPSKLPPVC